MKKIVRLSLIINALLLVLVASQAYAKPVYTGVYGTWGTGKDRMFQAAKNSGFQIVISSDVAKAQAMALKCLYPFQLTKEIAADPAQWEAFVGKVRTAVSANKNNPTVFGYYLADEPDWNNVPAQRYRELDRIIKSIDKTKPTLAVLTIPSKWHNYLSCFDIIAIDPYLTNTHKGTETEKVRDWIVKINRDFKKYKIKKELWVVLGAFEQLPKSGQAPAFRKPTPQEFSVMLDTCLAYKVSGILVFSLFKEESAANYGWNLLRDDPLLWDTVRQVPHRVPKQ